MDFKDQVVQLSDNIKKTKRQDSYRRSYKKRIYNANDCSLRIRCF